MIKTKILILHSAFFSEKLIPADDIVIHYFPDKDVFYLGEGNGHVKAEVLLDALNDLRQNALNPKEKENVRS